VTALLDPAAARLPDALQALRDRVAATPLGLATPDRDAAARAAKAVVDGMLKRAELHSARLLVVEERPLRDGRLDEEQVAPCAAGCTGWAADQEERASVVHALRPDHDRFCAAVTLANS